MISARMIVQMVQNDRALPVVMRTTRQTRDFGFQLLDQSLLVSGNDVHRPGLTWQRLKSGYLVAAKSSKATKKGGPSGPPFVRGFVAA